MPKNTRNIKEIEEDAPKKLKIFLKKDPSLKYLINFKGINLSWLIGKKKKHFTVLYIVS